MQIIFLSWENNKNTLTKTLFDWIIKPSTQKKIKCDSTENEYVCIFQNLKKNYNLHISTTNEKEKKKNEMENLTYNFIACTEREKENCSILNIWIW